MPGDRDQPAPGTRLTIVKLQPDRSEGARYPGEVIASPPGWVAARAVWTYRRWEVGPLVFEPDDVLLEYFALKKPFNAFGVYTPAGRFKGWYCNVTHPSWLEDTTLFWHDLYIDVVVTPDGASEVLDEDELDAAGVAERDPALYRTIIEARDLLLRRARAGDYPFSEAPSGGPG